MGQTRAGTVALREELETDLIRDQQESGVEFQSQRRQLRRIQIDVRSVAYQRGFLPGTRERSRTRGYDPPECCFSLRASRYDLATCTIGTGADCGEGAEVAILLGSGKARR